MRLNIFIPCSWSALPPPHVLPQHLQHLTVYSLPTVGRMRQKLVDTLHFKHNSDCVASTL